MACKFKVCIQAIASFNDNTMIPKTMRVNPNPTILLMRPGPTYPWAVANAHSRVGVSGSDMGKASGSGHILWPFNYTQSRAISTFSPSEGHDCLIHFRILISPVVSNVILWYLPYYYYHPMNLWLEPTIQAPQKSMPRNYSIVSRGVYGPDYPQPDPGPAYFRTGLDM